MDARTVAEPHIGDGRSLVDEFVRASEITADNVREMCGRIKGVIGFLQPAVSFDIDLRRAVDHDLRDGRFIKERLQDVETAHRVKKVANQVSFFLNR